MKLLRKLSKRRCIRQVIVYFLTWCLLFNTSVSVVLANPNPDPGALPTGLNEATSSGVVVNDPIGSSLTIDQTLPAAIANWQNFDIGKDASVHFNQLPTDAALNRVWDGDVTGIMGSLTGEGRVFIVNPAGVIFGEGATVNVNQLIASALDIDDLDFQNGIYNFAVPGIGEVANHGEIIANEGVALLGKNVRNTGTIVTEPGGFAVMAAGDSVWLSPQGSKIIIEMSSATGDGVGNVINETEGQIEAPSGQIVLAAGDIFSTALDLDSEAVKVDGGTGRVAQLGTINADGIDGDGGSVSLTGGEVVALGQDSLTTANAGTNGNGGEVIAYSPETALFRNGALVEAKGGTESGNGGFFELSGHQYVEVLGDIDLTATNGQSGMFLIDPLDLWVVDDISIDIQEGPTNTWKPIDEDPSVSKLDVDDLEGYLDLADVTLSTIGTSDDDPTQHGDIIFDFDTSGHGPLTSGASEESDSSLIVEAARNIEFKAGSSINFAGDGSVKLYAYDGGVKFENSTTNPAITSNSGLDSISTVRGNIIIEAGSGGIDVGTLTTANPSTSGEQPGEIRLQTVYDGIVQNDNEYDITTGRIEISGKGYGSVYINSAGDLTIENFDNGQYAVDVKINAVSEVEEDALSFICLIAGRDLTIESAGKKGVLADSDGKTNSVASIWLGAGTNVFDEDDGYPGTVTINGNLVAKASAPGDDFAKSDATIRVYGSEINLNGNQDPQASAKGGSIKYQDDESGYEISLDPDAVFEWDPDEKDSDPDIRNPIYDKLVSGSRALVDIDITKDGSCLNCENKEIKILFYVAGNEYDVDWRAGYTIEGLGFVDLAQLGILDNDDPEAQSATANIIILSVANGTLFLDTSGDYPQLKYMPPSYDEQFVWDGTSDFATFEDTFTYQVEITTEDGTFLSENTALVTITVQNEVPTLAGDSDTIHMNTNADFDLSTLVTDNDRTPGDITSFVVTDTDGDGIADNTYTAEGTAGSLTYGIVEGQIPLDAGVPITTGDSRLIPYYNGVAPLTIADSTITYTPLDGYVSPPDSPAIPTTFGYTVSDENIKEQINDDPPEFIDPAVFELPEGEHLEVTVTNELPSGDAWLGKTPMDTPKGPTNLEEGEFVDNLDAVQTEADDVSIIGTSFDGAEYLTGDPTSGYGGELTYDEGQDKWTYTPDTEGTENLLGYTGDKKDTWGEGDYRADEQFTVQLWDGQNKYELEGDTLSVEMVTNPGTVSVDLESGAELSGDGYFGLVHMDTTVTTTGLTDTGTLDSGNVVGGTTYNGTNYAGATLEYDEGTGQWTYTPAGSQTGYTGDSIDNWNLTGTGGYDPDIHPDEKFTVDLTTGEYTYTINENPEGPFLVLESGVPVKELTPYSGTVSVELSNVGPSATGGAETEHMATPGNMFTIDFGNAQDNEDTLTDFPGQTVLDDITVLLEGGTGNIETTKGMIELVDNSDGTFSFKYTPKEGATGQDVFTFTVSDGELGAVPQEATLTIELTNTRPSGNVGLTTHMDDPIVDGSISGSFTDDDDPITIGAITASNIDDNKTFGGDLEYNGSPEDNGTASEWDYDPDAALPGYVGDDEFDVELWDGEYDYIMVEGAAPEGYEFFSEGEGYDVYRAKEYGAGTVTVDLTNTLPSASGDLGETAPGTTLFVPQTDTTSPVLVLDPEPDSLSIVQAIIPDHYTGSAGGTLEFDGTQWIYTPVAGHTGPEQFIVNVSDGQNNYEFVEGDGWMAIPTPEYGTGTVSVTVEPPPPTFVPAAPVPKPIVWEVGGCPALMGWLADELGAEGDKLQFTSLHAYSDRQSAVGNQTVITYKGDIQWCQACANLSNAATVLADPNGSRMAALVATFNQFAPPEMPFTPEMADSIVAALDEAAEGSQYATVAEYIDAFAQYIALLDTELGSPVDDSTAFVMEKYGSAITESENPNIAAFVEMRLRALAGE